MSEELVMKEETDTISEVDETENAVADTEATEIVASADDIEPVSALAQEIEEEASATVDKPAASDITCFA